MNGNKTKHIKFDRLSSWRHLILVGIGTSSFLIGFWKYGYESNLFSVLGFLCVGLFFIRPFLYKRYVGWNKKSMQLKFGYFGMKSISFDTIKKVSIEDNLLSITRVDREVHKYDVADVDEADIRKLERIIIRHSNFSEA